MLQGLAVGLAAYLHDAAHGLQHEVAGAVLRVRPFLPEIGDRSDDNARVPFQQLVNGQTPAREGARAKAFNDDVAGAHQLADDGMRCAQTQVERDAALVPVQVLKEQALFGRADPGCKRRQGSREIAGDRLFDFDDLCAVVAEQARGKRTRDPVTEIENPYSVERA